MPDEINERHHDGGEDRGRGKRRDEESERGEQARIQPAPAEPIDPLLLAAVVSLWAAVFSALSGQAGFGGLVLENLRVIAPASAGAVPSGCRSAAGLAAISNSST